MYAPVKGRAGYKQFSLKKILSSLSFPRFTFFYLLLTLRVFPFSTRSAANNVLIHYLIHYKQAFQWASPGQKGSKRVSPTQPKPNQH